MPRTPVTVPELLLTTVGPRITEKAFCVLASPLGAHVPCELRDPRIAEKAFRVRHPVLILLLAHSSSSDRDDQRREI
jgi:hypothetical protein